MPRIRTLKPEFWDSPSTAEAGPWARLCFMGMWNWADDYGRGTANLKELEGFIFPNDDTFTDRSGNTVHFRDVVAEVMECFGVVLYEVHGRSYYEIPSWDRHQRNERRAAKSKHPGPDHEDALTREYRKSADMHGISAPEERKCADGPNISGPGTGEQGNRGTGEQGNSAPNGAGRKPPAAQLAIVDAEIVEPTPTATAQTLIGEWIDHQTVRPPGKVLGQVSKELKALLEEGQPYEDVRAGLAAWSTKGLHPSAIPSVVYETRTAQPRTRQDRTDAIFAASLARAAAGTPNPFMTDEERRNAK